jgi:predicted Zn-dependent peptidase
VKKLATGLTVITLRRPAPAAVAWLAFRGGASDAEPPLLVEMAVRVRPEAHQAMKLQILPGRGATRDMSFDSVEFLPERLPESLALLFAKATAPVKEWPSREGMARLLAPALAAEDDRSRKADREFWHALLGDHPLAHTVNIDDVDKLTRSDIDAWVGRVHTLRNAALIVVGDLEPRAVERAASVMSQQLKTPDWVTELPGLAPVAPRAGKDARASAPVAVVSGRPGTLTEIRLGCVLPAMAAADRGHYELLTNAIEARLDAALRVDDGDSYGVQVAFDRLRGGTTLLVATTFVGQETLARSLAAIRGNWQRWGRDGFDAGEINVARWRYAGSLTLLHGNPHALALQLAKAWGNEPEALASDRLLPDVAGLRAPRVNELFATCKSNAVLALTGNEALVRRALEQIWPGLPAPRRR